MTFQNYFEPSEFIQEILIAVVTFSLTIYFISEANILPLGLCVVTLIGLSFWIKFHLNQRVTIESDKLTLFTHKFPLTPVIKTLQLSNSIVATFPGRDRRSASYFLELKNPAQSTQDVWIFLRATAMKQLTEYLTTHFPHINWIKPTPFS